MVDTHFVKRCDELAGIVCIDKLGYHIRSPKTLKSFLGVSCVFVVGWKSLEPVRALTLNHSDVFVVVAGCIVIVEDLCVCSDILTKILADGYGTRRGLVIGVALATLRPGDFAISANFTIFTARQMGECVVFVEFRCELLEFLRFYEQFFLCELS